MTSTTERKSFLHNYAGMRKRLLSQLLACLTGVGGGWVANKLGVPLGWMVGAMLATGICAAAGIKVSLPGQLRWLVLAVVGVYLGSTFSPDVLSWLGRSVITLLSMFGIVFLETAIAASILYRALRCNAVTALTACVPGGFSTMVLLAGSHGGDEEVVAVVQLVRMVMVISVISLAARYAIDYDQMEIQHPSEPRELTYAVLLALAGLVVGVVARMPILCLFVPMAAGAFLQLGSFTHLVLPGEPLIFALVVLGTSVGAEWKNLRGKKLLTSLLAGFLLGVFLIGISYVAAVGMHQLLDLEELPLILAFAPGGVAEISLISVALNIEPSFVVLHHLLRVVFILVCLPFIFQAIAAKVKKRRALKKQLTNVI